MRVFAIIGCLVASFALRSGFASPVAMQVFVDIDPDSNEWFDRELRASILGSTMTLVVDRHRHTVNDIVKVALAKRLGHSPISFSDILTKSFTLAVGSIRKFKLSNPVLLDNTLTVEQAGIKKEQSFVVVKLHGWYSTDYMQHLGPEKAVPILRKQQEYIELAEKLEKKFLGQEWPRDGRMGRDTCPVCLEEIEPLTMVESGSVVACNGKVPHLVHKKCMDKWVKDSKCFKCREAVVDRTKELIAVSDFPEYKQALILFQDLIQLKKDNAMQHSVDIPDKQQKASGCDSDNSHDSPSKDAPTKGETLSDFLKELQKKVDPVVVEGILTSKPNDFEYLKWNKKAQEVVREFGGVDWLERNKDGLLGVLHAMLNSKVIANLMSEAKRTVHLGGLLLSRNTQQMSPDRQQKIIGPSQIQLRNRLTSDGSEILTLDFEPGVTNWSMMSRMIEVRYGIRRDLCRFVPASGDSGDYLDGRVVEPEMAERMIDLVPPIKSRAEGWRRQLQGNIWFPQSQVEKKDVL